MRIKKTISITGIAIGSVLALYVTFMVVLMLSCTSDNRIAASPERIARRAGFNLPGYEVLDYRDNSDRGSSAWSCTEWTLSLKNPVSPKLRDKLNELYIKDAQWRYDMSRDTYHYVRELKGMNDSPEVQISVDCKTGTVKMYYTWWDFLS